LVLSPPVLETKTTVNTLLIRLKYVKTHFGVVRKKKTTTFVVDKR